MSFASDMFKSSLNGPAQYTVIGEFNTASAGLIAQYLASLKVDVLYHTTLARNQPSPIFSGAHVLHCHPPMFEYAKNIGVAFIKEVGL